MSGKDSAADLVFPTPTPTNSFSFAAALCKLVLGPLAVVFAGMALLVDADLARVGSGFWAGAVATTAGAIGVCVRSAHAHRPRIGLVAWTGLSLGSSALLIVLAGTGLAHDSMAAGRTWPPALAANAVLLAIATADCLASIVALAVELGTNHERHFVSASANDYRLIHWLQTQRHLLVSIFSQLYPTIRARNSSELFCIVPKVYIVVSYLNLLVEPSQKIIVS
uniref:Uncharacterized protein n=1 Tax=Strigamia maritima TaxID=126957 RepID=T1J1H6_STRMM